MGAVFFAVLLFLAITVASGSVSAREGSPTTALEKLLAEVTTQLFIQPADEQLNFVLGMTLAELGRYMEAADVFRRMLARNPLLLRPRLELGRVLLLAGDHGGARYHFEQVLGHDLPDGVKFNVLRLLAHIREQSPSFSILFDLILDSNPGRATSAREIEIDSVRFVLNSDSRARSSIGTHIIAEGRIPLPSAPLTHVRGSFERIDHGGRDLDFRYYQAAFGRHLNFTRNTVTLEAGQHWANFRHDALYRGSIFSISDYRRIRQDVALRSSFSLHQLDYSELTFRSGWQRNISGRLTYVATPRSRWDAHVAYIDSDAREDAYGFDMVEASVRQTIEWSGGWVTGATVEVARARYDAPDPFFGVRRADREISVEATLLHRNFRLWRLSPQLRIGFTDHRSNIDLYAFRRAHARIGMSAEF